MSAPLRIAAALTALALGAATVAAQDGPPDGSGEIVPRDWLVIGPLDDGGRRPFTPDAVFAAHLLDPRSRPPEEGDELMGETGSGAWEARTADERGQLEGPLGWAYARVRVEQDVVMLAETQRVRGLYVNGEGFAGDLYGLGRGPVAVALRAGANHLFVKPRSGGFLLRLLPAPGPLFLSEGDVTAPDLIAGRPLDGLAGVTLINAGTRPLREVALTAGGEHGFATRRAEELPPLPPLAVVKLPVPVELLEPAPDAGGSLSLPLSVSAEATSGPKVPPAEGRVELSVREPRAAQRITFLSRIDRSVQAYAVLPPEPRPGEREPRWLAHPYDPTPNERDGLVLSLHGAGVGCLGQARAYSPKDGLWIVAPTNRGKFGFDWQDWGRLDAYEVLRDARLAFRLDARRTWLTGHSMGGHGTWHLAANDPYGFLAIAPSAGWRSFDTYGGRPDGALRELWHRADGASLTEELVGNLVQVPAYILHGRDDDNVPLSEAQAMEALLKEHGATPRVHYQPGAGHWWDGQRAAGADCVDWPDVFRTFAEVEIADLREELDLTLPAPAQGPAAQWARPLQALRYGRPLRLEARSITAAGIVDVTTENVRRLGLTGLSELVARGAPKLVIDGQTLSLPAAGAWVLVRDDAGTWALDDGARGPGAPPEKTPVAQGPLKQAFTQDFLLIYPTGGEEEQTAASLARARHDAQTWWYRANGCARLVSDVDWLEHGDTWSLGGNVVLYGNADTNAAWDLLIGDDGPLSVSDGQLRVGDTTFHGDDLGALFLRPRGRRHLVGALASTGVRGDRLGNTLNLFVSGVGYPDYVAFSSRVLQEGDGGVLAAGFFDHAWELDGHGFLAADAPETRARR